MNNILDIIERMLKLGIASINTSHILFIKVNDY